VSLPEKQFKLAAGVHVAEGCLIQIGRGHLVLRWSLPILCLDEAVENEVRIVKCSIHGMVVMDEEEEEAERGGT
jgi:hypothetical protein